MSAVSTAPVRSAFAAVFRLVLGQLVTKARIAAVAGLSGLLVVIGVLVARSDSRDLVKDGAELVTNLGLAVVVTVIALLFASAALGDLREDKTLVYLWLTPMSPWIVPLAATAASAVIVVPIVVVPTLATAAIVSTSGGLVAGTLLATVLAAFAYNSLFTALGLFTRRTLVWGVAYILIWEGFVAAGGAGAARFALRAHATSILAGATATDLRLGDLAPSTAVVVLIAVTVVSVVTAVWRYRSMTVD